MVDFSKEHEVRTWAEGLTREGQASFAFRAAASAYPGIAKDDAETTGRLALPVARAMLISGVAAVGATPEIREAARSADSAARSAAFSAARHYMEVLDADEGGLLEVPLWHDAGLPAGLSDGLEVLPRRWEADPATWDFWRRWYEDLLSGTHLDWDLQRQVALLPDEVWEAGAEEVAAEIAKNEQEHQPFTRESALTQAPLLPTNPIQNALVAQGLSELISLVTDAYRREISNALPDALEPLDDLQRCLDQLVGALHASQGAGASQEDLADLVLLLANTVAELNLRLKESQTSCGPSGGRIFHDAFYKKLGEGAAGLVTSKVLWGGIIAGGTVLLGTDAEALFSRMADCYEQVVVPQKTMPPNPGAESRPKAAAPSSGRPDGPAKGLPQRDGLRVGGAAGIKYAAPNWGSPRRGPTMARLSAYTVSGA